MPDAKIARSSFLAYKSLNKYAVEKSTEIGTAYQAAFGMYKIRIVIICFTLAFFEIYSHKFKNKSVRHKTSTKKKRELKKIVKNFLYI